jgi:transposase
MISRFGTPPPGVRVLIATRPVDFRRGAEGLARTVPSILQQDPFGGTGLVLIWKRLEGATFKWPPANDRRQMAAEVLQQIAELYRIGAEIRGEEADQRRAVRQRKSKPLVAALKSWLEKTLRQVASGSSIAQVIRYGFNQWDGLLRFLDDGRIEIGSNTIERSMRPIALNRKNALVAGSDEGAENWAMLASLIETRKLHGIHPQACLTDVLTTLVNSRPNRRLGALLPWA